MYPPRHTSIAIDRSTFVLVRTYTSVRLAFFVALTLLDPFVRCETLSYLDRRSNHPVNFYTHFETIPNRPTGLSNAVRPTTSNAITDYANKRFLCENRDFTPVLFILERKNESTSRVHSVALRSDDEIAGVWRYSIMTLPFICYDCR